jgi:hypothetical protein
MECLLASLRQVGTSLAPDICASITVPPWDHDPGRPAGCRAAYAACQRGRRHPGRTSPDPRADSRSCQAEPRRTRRPCHPHAISSGHLRYVADDHGHLEGPLRWVPAS